MDPIFNKKGQTALEYLLIVVVAIIVVVAVMVFMQGMTDDTTSRANESGADVLCGTYTNEDDCDAAPGNCEWDSARKVCKISN
jgi:uncharacterized protein (UPF0333 family)